jgi:hypothetical protein
MADRYFWIAFATIFLAAPAGAQQAACRSVYMLGEAVPAHCRASVRSGVPAYQQWGDGRVVGTQGRPEQGPMLYDRRYQSGYNSSYGLGR